VAGGQEPGEDIELGHSLVFRLEGEGDVEGDAQLSARAIEVLKQRIDPDGLKDIEFVPLDSGLVEIRLPPGAMEPEELKGLIGSAGSLEFRVAPREPEMRPPSELSRLVDDDDRDRYVAALQKGRGAGVDVDSAFKWFPVEGELDWYRVLALIVADGPDGRGYILLSDRSSHCMTHAQPDGGDWRVVQAEATHDSQGYPAIRIRLDGAGAARMRRLSEANLHRHLAIVLDGRAYSAPNIAGVMGRDLQITGRFSAEEVARLIRVLRTGALPARIDPEWISQSSFEWPGSPSPGSRKTTWGSSGWLLPVGLVAGGVLVLGALGYGVMRSRRPSV
jgi:preprotein translocase subunit SecD